MGRRPHLGPERQRGSPTVYRAALADHRLKFLPTSSVSAVVAVVDPVGIVGGGGGVEAAMALAVKVVLASGELKFPTHAWTVVVPGRLGSVSVV